MRRFLLQCLGVLCVITLVSSVLPWMDSFWHSQSLRLAWVRRDGGRVVDRIWKIESRWDSIAIQYSLVDCDEQFADGLMLENSGMHLAQWCSPGDHQHNLPTWFYVVTRPDRFWPGTRWGDVAVFRMQFRDPGANENAYGVVLPYWPIMLLSGIGTVLFLRRRSRRRMERGFAVEPNASITRAPPARSTAG